MPYFNMGASHSTSHTQGSFDKTDTTGETVSKEKWEYLIGLITGKLLDTAADAGTIPADSFDDENHPLSIASMQLYLISYWKHFHEYLPLLHYPTFSPEAAHTYLLMAVLIVGSSMLTRQKGFANRGMKATNLMAWNLRGHVLLHVDASSPSRLWVFQTLLLLEFHDKLLASASLHDRALVFFPTTLNLMRQSSTLFGRQVPKSPKLPTEFTTEPGATGGPELSVGFFAPQKPSTSRPESWWEHWIVQEAIRRAAFSAFVLDITHSVMFGHSQTLVFHEIHLFLPCDRLLWSSHSPSEIGAVESSLYASGVQPFSFLEALRKMFKRQPCRTNVFGWLSLLSGLLSIVGHMQQRDILASSLEHDLVSAASDKWQPKLILALQWWKSEYENNLEHLRGAGLDWRKYSLSEENRNGGGNDLAMNLVLYHLGNISIYITMPELSVAAGASKILGRLVSPFEKRMMKEKVARWADSPGAVHTLYHALELIRLICPAMSDPRPSREPQPTVSESQGIPDEPIPRYKASYDKLPNRSWALYFATMVIWAYGFHHDGPLKPFPTNLGYPPNPTASTEPYDPVRCGDRDDMEDGAQESAARDEDARMYLDCVFPPSVKSPQEFARHIRHLAGGRNRVLGLLGVVDWALSGTSWELLDEARKRLKTAAVILKNGSAM
ncbi:hypothetical protein CONLIGDRAFT_676942 [Coniochaeta ligniaria NRRL 30616]|uniref:Xylanolytic transcriptional activator regulatory domain-containing protein n=1 Tax=Coniochaeta ligniaria NRRL 30616 TaxID=1408157 RepID=A0A1J7JZ68_9PEZI|nr:hypothetical protein CONLIGDRAFT_676942 [Coniochaeta ligniaria NRRL 30616]